MKTVGLLVVLAAVVTEASSEYGTLSPWANVTALACVVGLLIFVVARFVPQMIHDGRDEVASLIKEHRAERASDRAEWLAALERRDSALTIALSRHTEAIEKMVGNCAARAEQFRKDHPSGPV